MQTWQDLTDMFKTADILQEMKKKYVNTYLGIKHNDSTTYVKYKGYSDSNQQIFIDKNNEILFLNLDTAFDVFIPTLTKQVVNTNKGVYYVYRNPFRQFKRGLSEETHSISKLSSACTPHKDTIFLYRPYLNEFNAFIFEVLENKNKIYSLEASLDLCDKYSSWALNKTFSLILNPKTMDSDIYLLCLLDCPVAWLNKKEKTISVFAHEFLQEILDHSNIFQDYRIKNGTTNT